MCKQYIGHIVSVLPAFLACLSGNTIEFLLGYCVVIKPAASRCASTEYKKALK